MKMDSSRVDSPSKGFRKNKLCAALAILFIASVPAMNAQAACGIESEPAGAFTPPPAPGGGGVSTTAPQPPSYTGDTTLEADDTLVAGNSLTEALPDVCSVATDANDDDLVWILNGSDSGSMTVDGVTFKLSSSGSGQLLVVTAGDGASAGTRTVEIAVAQVGQFDQSTEAVSFSVEVQAAEAVVPVTPEEPVVPEEPATPEEPVVPEEPVAPEEPVVSEEPAAPEEPVVSEEPEAPEAPPVTEVPEAPEAPPVAEAPEAPEAPVVSEEPGTPETPVVSEEPEVPAVPEPLEPPEGSFEPPQAPGEDSDVDEVEQPTSEASSNTLIATPFGLEVLTESATEIAFSWNASNEGNVAGYNVYRDGIYQDTVEVPSYSDVRVNSGNIYQYSVSAFDGNGNFSLISGALISIASDNASPFEYAKPTPPPAVIVRQVAGLPAVLLTWAEGADDEGVAGYNIYRDGIYMGTSLNQVYVDGTATSDTHEYHLVAFDERGNFSVDSLSVAPDSSAEVQSSTLIDSVLSAESQAVGGSPVWVLNNSGEIVILISGSDVTAIWPKVNDATAKQVLLPEGADELQLYVVDRESGANDRMLQVGVDASGYVVLNSEL